MFATFLPTQKKIQDGQLKKVSYQHPLKKKKILFPDYNRSVFELEVKLHQQEELANLPARKEKPTLKKSIVAFAPPNESQHDLAD